MVGFGTPTTAERLRIIADNLNRAYAPTPTEETGDLRALIIHLRANGRRGLPNVRQLCAGVSPDDEKEHLIICPTCGQMFDCRDQADLEHHSNEAHAPKYVLRPS
jgi:uncharacterized C2H2 Zn-finger protein